MERQPGSVMHYPPEAWAYALFQADIRTHGVPQRTDELPEFSPEEPPYLSFSEEDIEVWKRALDAGDSCIELFRALDEHDHARPYHSTEQDWQRRIVQMPHLKDTLPGPQDSIEHLRDAKGWLPAEFYLLLHKDHALFGLPKILEWGDPKNFIHARSQTLEGGPLGYDNPKVDAHYGTTPHKVRFPDTYIDYLDNAIQSLISALYQSTRTLLASVDERGVTDPQQRVEMEIQARHKRFPIGARGVILKTATEVIDLWQNHIVRPPSPTGEPPADAGMMELVPPDNELQPSEEEEAPSVEVKGKAPEVPTRPRKRPLSAGERATTSKERRVQFDSHPEGITSDDEPMYTDDPTLNLGDLEISSRTTPPSTSRNAPTNRAQMSTSAMVVEVEIPVKGKSSKGAQRR
ncbi:hypothetical protein RSAG8_12560, partial [Rhizoctonia solani AG-8 WAC10335]